jgi:hypothetical protein
MLCREPTKTRYSLRSGGQGRQLLQPTAVAESRDAASWMQVCRAVVVSSGSRGPWPGRPILASRFRVIVPVSILAMIDIRGGVQRPHSLPTARLHRRPVDRTIPTCPEASLSMRTEAANQGPVSPMKPHARAENGSAGNATRHDDTGSLSSSGSSAGRDMPAAMSVVPRPTPFARRTPRTALRTQIPTAGTSSRLAGFAVSRGGSRR